MSRRYLRGSSLLDLDLKFLNYKDKDKFALYIAFKISLIARIVFVSYT